MVIEKCGMAYIGEGEVGNHPVRVYEIITPPLNLNPLFNISEVLRIPENVFIFGLRK